MDAKERAYSLINRFMFAGIYFTTGDDGAIKNAKSCALIAVDEIIPCTWKLETYKNNGYISVDEKTTTEYWQQVKQEIEKL